MPDNDLTKLLTDGTDELSNASLVVMFSSFMANKFMQGPMSFVWGLLNCLQILAHFPLVNINMPANAHIVFMLLVKIANIQIIENADEILNDV